MNGLPKTPLIVEFISTPGAGKTSLLPAVREFFTSQRRHSWGVIQAARPFAQRTAAGKIVNSLAPASMRGPFLCAAKDGRIEAYIHQGGKLGVLLEVNCESDFVARNDDFKEFVRDLAMQVAALNPIYVSKEDVPQSAIDKEKEIIQAQIKDKPAAAVEKITEGKLLKFYEDACLLEQPYVKDQSIKVKDIVTNMIAKIGENIVVRRFTRFQVGEELKG